MRLSNGGHRPPLAFPARMKPSGKLRALAASARLANMPSVLGNVFLGFALTRQSLRGSVTPVEWSGAWLAGAAGLCLYASGNFLNDWADRNWDARHRPERALPRGLFPPAIYLSLAVLLGGAGVALAGLTEVRGLGISLLIVLMIAIYTWLHKRSAWSVVPMGLCRALLPLLGFATTWGNPLDAGIAAFAVLCHIVSLSLAAMGESKDGQASFPWIAGLAEAAAIIAMLLLAKSLTPLWFAWYGAIPAVILSVLCHPIFCKSKRALVSTMLAGIPLIDAILLLPLALALRDSAGFWTPVSLACLLVPPLAFVAGRALQRFAPAT